MRRLYSKTAIRRNGRLTLATFDALRLFGWGARFLPISRPGFTELLVDS